ncbi:MAG: pantoate--beta-alanine ligase [Pseudomonadales bacterium]|nr:pantoate--beta-alanine ligase [Pseudomonadales bacterium]
MRVITDSTTLRDALHPLRQRGQRIALVPTMGNLHEGHLALITEARKHASFVVCTIFVNPMQFGPTEDLDAYPRTLEQDIARLEAAGCHALFTPSVAEMYPLGHQQHTVVSVPGLSEGYCGASRPGHFDGVATVVCKLFNLVQPDTAVFGLKDYQQFLVIRRMVADLCLPIALVGVPTQREPSGLALSSRNGYLSAEEKARAATLVRSLREAASALQSGTAVAVVEAQASRTLQEAGFRPDYFSVCHAQTLAPATAQDDDLVILAAAWMGKTRLIDNLTLSRHKA